ncbi:MAG: hypothetical protein DSM106950_23700 [Stigonema ocellatum SAG 48.90 = DSM 106950]|nr:hypothetical protein [Stigonema ocellatum SAG 48.90 = DSM 106950]
MADQKEFNIDIFREQVIKAIELISFSESLDESQIKAYSSGSEKSKEEAEQIVRRKDIKEYICPGLKSLTNDTFNIANTIIPVLVGAILSGTLMIPLDPMLFGWITVAIAKAGTASLCNDYDSEKK